MDVCQLDIQGLHTGTHEKDIAYQSWVSLLFLLFMLMLSLRMTRSITNPIEKLAVNARKIGFLNLKNVARVKSRIIEIHHLDKAIDESVRALLAFKKFVPSDAINTLIEQGHKLAPSAELKNLTVMFIDIQGFSSIAEKIHPLELVPQLSEYFEHVSKIIVHFGGTLDKYVGDGIMVLWGAPQDLAESELQACRAALAIQKTADELNAQWVSDGKNAFPICIGLHSGPVVVGLFGSESRLAYTALGDTVNVASRVEGLNRVLGTRILLSWPVQQALGGRLPTRHMGSLELRGREEPMQICELLEPGSEVPEPPERAENSLG